MKMVNVKSIYIVALLILCSPSSYANDAKSAAQKQPAKAAEKKSESKEPPKIGNFALSGSQQPGPLIGFGGNIFDKNQVQIVLETDGFFSAGGHAIDVGPGLLFGVTDNFSLFYGLPLAASFKQDDNHSYGLEDIFVQAEYAFYNKKTVQYTDQATIVGNVSFPTGSSYKQPPTGFGAMSYFLGATYNRTFVDWLIFAAPGLRLTDASDRNKFGNEYLYQLMIGRNIYSVVSKWIVAALVELDGQYTQKDRISGQTDPNSGGNVINLTPSLWVSSKHLIFQLGVGAPISQHLLGEQQRNHYLLASSLKWTF